MVFKKNKTIWTSSVFLMLRLIGIIFMPTVFVLEGRKKMWSSLVTLLHFLTVLKYIKHSSERLQPTMFHHQSIDYFSPWMINNHQIKSQPVMVYRTTWWLSMKSSFIHNHICSSYSGEGAKQIKNIFKMALTHHGNY